jgi:rhodanese-related sulfurtransferase
MSHSRLLTVDAEYRPRIGTRGIGRMTPLALLKRFENPEGLTLVDIREPAERAISVIPVPEGMAELFIPMGQVPARVDEIQEALGRGPVVIYCHHGVRSMTVANWLARQGLSGIHNLDGGIDAWSLDIDPDVRRY